MSEGSCHKTRELVKKYRSRIIQQAVEDNRRYLLSEVEKAKEKVINDFLKTTSPKMYNAAMDLLKSKAFIKRVRIAWRILCGKKK